LPDRHWGPSDGHGSDDDVAAGVDHGYRVVVGVGDEEVGRCRIDGEGARRSADGDIHAPSAGCAGQDGDTRAQGIGDVDMVGAGFDRDGGGREAKGHGRQRREGVGIEHRQLGVAHVGDVEAAE